MKASLKSKVIVAVLIVGGVVTLCWITALAWATEKAIEALLG